MNGRDRSSPSDWNSRDILNSLMVREVGDCIAGIVRILIMVILIMARIQESGNTGYVRRKKKRNRSTVRRREGVKNVEKNVKNVERQVKNPAGESFHGREV